MILALLDLLFHLHIQSGQTLGLNFQQTVRFILAFFYLFLAMDLSFEQVLSIFWILQFY